MTYNVDELSFELQKDMIVYECVCLKIKEICNKIDQEFKKLNK